MRVKRKAARQNMEGVLYLGFTLQEAESQREGVCKGCGQMSFF